jgi:hypothetical protein
MNTAFLLLFSVVFGLMRASGAHGEIFQALAHVFVGGLFAAWLALGWRNWRSPYLWLGTILSILEVACFLHYGKQ